MESSDISGLRLDPMEPAEGGEMAHGELLAPRAAPVVREHGIRTDATTSPEDDLVCEDNPRELIMTVRQLRQALFAIRDQDRPIEASEVLALLNPGGGTQVEPDPTDGTRVDLAPVERLAIRDADALHATYRGEPSRVFDGRANGAWHAAAAELGVDPTDPKGRALYLKTLVARCGQISDEQD